jgi:hypothetical protein
MKDKRYLSIGVIAAFIGLSIELSPVIAQAVA